MENTASERDMEYLRQVGFNPQRGTGRGFNRGGHLSPAKRGHFDQGYGRGQSQGQNFRGSFGQGKGQGHNRYGINFSDANATELGQRGRQEQEVEGYSGYSERGGYQDYGHQEENYGQGGAYDDNNMEGGEGQDDYNFYTSNWMEPPEKIPASERDIDPDTIGKPQFPNDFYCKVCLKYMYLTVCWINFTCHTVNIGCFSITLLLLYSWKFTCRVNICYIYENNRFLSKSI